MKRDRSLKSWELSCGVWGTEPLSLSLGIEWEEYGECVLVVHTHDQGKQDIYGLGGTRCGIHDTLSTLFLVCAFGREIWMEVQKALRGRKIHRQNYCRKILENAMHILSAIQLFKRISMADLEAVNADHMTTQPTTYHKSLC